MFMVKNVLLASKIPFTSPPPSDPQLPSIILSVLDYMSANSLCHSIHHITLMRFYLTSLSSKKHYQNIFVSNYYPKRYFNFCFPITTHLQTKAQFLPDHLVLM